MSKTDAPEPPPDVLRQLDASAMHFRADIHRPRQARRCGAYPHGLLADGGRKGIEPTAARLARRRDLDVSDPDQALHQVVNPSPGDEQRVGRHSRRLMAETPADPGGIFVLDDTNSPEQGRHPVGVRRPDCGAWGEAAGCRVAPSVHPVSPRGHRPVIRRLDLPGCWPGDAERLDEAGVPEAERRSSSTGRIAPESLDRVRGAGEPGRVVVADAGDGVARGSRDGLRERGLDYHGAVTEERVVLTEGPHRIVPAGRGRGRRPTRPRSADDSPQPARMKDPASRTPWRTVTWREGATGERADRFAWLRGGPGQGWQAGDCAFAGPVWLRIGQQADGELEDAFSALPADTRRLRAVRPWMSRRPVEQGFRQMKGGLGLAHSRAVPGVGPISTPVRWGWPMAPGRRDESSWSGRGLGRG